MCDRMYRQSASSFVPLLFLKGAVALILFQLLVAVCAISLDLNDLDVEGAFPLSVSLSLDLSLLTSLSLLSLGSR